MVAEVNTTPTILGALVRMCIRRDQHDGHRAPVTGRGVSRAPCRRPGENGLRKPKPLAPLAGTIALVRMVLMTV